MTKEEYLAGKSYCVTCGYDKIKQGDIQCYRCWSAQQNNMSRNNSPRKRNQ